MFYLKWTRNCFTPYSESKSESATNIYTADAKWLVFWSKMSKRIKNDTKTLLFISDKWTFSIQMCRDENKLWNESSTRYCYKYGPERERHIWPRTSHAVFVSCVWHFLTSETLSSKKFLISHHDTRYHSYFVKFRSTWDYLQLLVHTFLW